jgi:hypothetical protein
VILIFSIHDHIKKYGKYGIGLKKEWAIGNRVNPILYLNSNSFIKENLNKIAEILFSSLIEKKTDVNDWYKFLYLIALTKEYKNYHTGEIYYKEREWRFFPIKKDGSIGVNSKIIYSNNLYLEHENFKVKNDNDLHLKFTLQDIKKIFIDKNEDLVKFKDEIEGLDLKSEEKENLKIKIEIL